MSDNNNNQLAPHEAAELHEIISGSVLNFKKLQDTLPMVKDQELKNFVQESLSATKIELDEMQNFVSSLEQ